MSLINDKLYCNTLTTRGVEQNHSVESIVQEVKELVVLGYKEVTLVGQNIDAYGKDMILKKKFFDLLTTVTCGAVHHGRTSQVYITGVHNNSNMSSL
eukprot:1629092-Ditylum_brightwellii.AAC.1